MSATNPIGPGTRNLSVNVPNSVHAELSGLAQESNMRLGEYCRFVLQNAIRERMTFQKRQPEKYAVRLEGRTAP